MMDTSQYSYPLRKVIGILGMALPLILIAGNWGVERSISFYYYTKMSTVFTGILITFGLVLLTYTGRKEINKRNNEKLLTTFGGIFALLVALVPTKYGCDIEAIFYVHNDIVRGWIHNGSAVLFIFLMGLVVLLKFSKDKYFKKLYLISGWLVMLGLAFTIISFIIKPFNNAVFWGETFCLWAFGLAWLRRGIRFKRGKTQ